ncbi:MAG: 16S/23S rRNA (cytidine-2'-O)-methyltransferase, partial [Blastococcus sp.]|nr:16S/23S rRNA (cytidine-2'-O)-methyltransferase [Blastococcus sp.]
MARRRLDAELVRRGLARSREHAVALIAEGRVAVSGRAATKPATGVDAGDPVVVRTDPDRPSWVSRGAHKLLGALEAFPVEVAGRRALDAGASTGGFTEVLLRRGAAEVVAVDVGYGELAWPLRT